MFGFTLEKKSPYRSDHLGLRVDPRGMMGTIRGSVEECNLVGPALSGLYLILRIPAGLQTPRSRLEWIFVKLAWWSWNYFDLKHLLKQIWIKVINKSRVPAGIGSVGAGCQAAAGWWFDKKKKAEAQRVQTDCWVTMISSFNKPRTQKKTAQWWDLSQSVDFSLCDNCGMSANMKNDWFVTLVWLHAELVCKAWSCIHFLFGKLHFLHDDQNRRKTDHH